MCARLDWQHHSADTATANSQALECRLLPLNHVDVMLDCLIHLIRVLVDVEVIGRNRNLASHLVDFFPLQNVALNRW